VTEQKSVPGSERREVICRLKKHIRMRREAQSKKVSAKNN